MKNKVEELVLAILMAIAPVTILIGIFGVKYAFIFIAIALLLFAVAYAIIYLICKSIYQYIKAKKGHEIEISFRNPVVIKWQRPILIKTIL